MACYLGRSKGDRQLKGRVFKCPALSRVCSVTAFKAWVSLAGLIEGPGFRKIDRWDHVAEVGLHANSLIPMLRSLFTEAGVVCPKSTPATPCTVDLLAGPAPAAGILRN